MASSLSPRGRARGPMGGLQPDPLRGTHPLWAGAQRRTPGRGFLVSRGMACCRWRPREARYGIHVRQGKKSSSRRCGTGDASGTLARDWSPVLARVTIEVPSTKTRRTSSAVSAGVSHYAHWPGPRFCCESVDDRRSVTCIADLDDRNRTFSCLVVVCSLLRPSQISFGCFGAWTRSSAENAALRRAERPSHQHNTGINLANLHRTRVQKFDCENLCRLESSVLR